MRTVGELALGTALLPWVACEITPRAPGLRADAAVGKSIGTCLPFLTPLDAFYRQFGGSATVEGWALPDLDSMFELRIDGLVSQELSLTLADLESDIANQQTVVKTMICVLGFRSTAIWTGVPLRVWLDRAGIDRGRAVRIRLFGADGFENNLRIDDIYDAPADLFEPLIAFRIYGQPLPRELGFPFRLLLGDRYGYKNTKWLARVQVTDSDEVTGQYQARGYPDAGVIEPVAIVDNLRLSETVPRGPVELCGFALSGHAGIERVELAVDDNAFKSARLSTLGELEAEFPELATSVQLGDATRFAFPLRGLWVAWRFSFDAKPGTHRVQIRVRDRSGESGQSTELHLTAKA